MLSHGIDASRDGDMLSLLPGPTSTASELSDPVDTLSHGHGASRDGEFLPPLIGLSIATELSVHGDTLSHGHGKGAHIFLRYDS